MNTIKLDGEFLSSSDIDWLGELISDFLEAKGIQTDSFSFDVEIDYVPSEIGD
jgi:hypothetical protein